MTLTNEYGVAKTIYVALLEAGTGRFKNTPTLAAGDFKISKDGGAFANLTTLPTVTPAAGVQVAITVSATEAEAECFQIICADQTVPAQWDDLSITVFAADKDGYSLSSDSASFVAETVGDELAVQLDAIQDKTDLIRTGNMTVVSPVSESGDITVYAGDSYNTALGNALEWSSDDWPDLTGATLDFKVSNIGGSFTPTLTVVTGGTGTQTIRVEMTLTQSATFRYEAEYKFRIRATISTRIITLVEGTMTVKP